MMGSRFTSFLPAYELDWSVTHFDYNDADKYTGTYHDGTAYTNIYAIVGKRILCLKQAMVASGWEVLQSSVAGAVSSSDLWTNAPDIERGTGHWIVLRGPDGISQLVIQKDHVAHARCFYFYWSPSGAFSQGTLPLTRPTAPDEIAPGTETPNAGNLYLYTNDVTTGAFYAFRGLRGEEVTSRVLQICGAPNGRIAFMFNLEWFVTDLPVSQLPRNFCLLAFNTGPTRIFWDKDYTRANLWYLRITMPDGKFALATAQFCPTPYPGHWVSEFTGTLDSKNRMLPVCVQEYSTSGDHQFYGYIPDMYFGNNSGALASWYNYRTFGGTWARYAELCLPVFDTDYATNLGDVAGAAAVVSTPYDANEDTYPPTFAGVVSATVIDDNTVRLAWEPGADEISMTEALRYEVHCSSTPGAAFSKRGEVVGTITHDVTLLKPGTTYYFRVRCRDEAGNHDLNAVELSATTTGVIDIVKPSATLISPPESQPIGPHTTHVIDVEDEHLLRRVWIVVKYPASTTLPRETIYDGDEFEPVYFGNCSRTTLIEGKKFRYYITRTTGWKSKPRITVRAIDAGGNEIELLS